MFCFVFVLFFKTESLSLIISHLILKVKNEFYGHHAKPVTLAWSPDNEHFATGGMDMMVYVWTVGDADQRIKLPGRPYKGHTWMHSYLACMEVYTAVPGCCSV